MGDNRGLRDEERLYKSKPVQKIIEGVEATHPDYTRARGKDEIKRRVLQKMAMEEDTKKMLSQLGVIGGIGYNALKGNLEHDYDINDEWKIRGHYRKPGANGKKRDIGAGIFYETDF